MLGSKVRIRYPVKLQRKATKLLQSENYKKETELRKRPLLIKCSIHPHRSGQTYGSSEGPLVLSSEHWLSNNSIGRHFEFKAVPSSRSNHAPSFKSLGLRSDVVEALNDQNFIHPTNVQARAVPRILSEESENSDFIVASETGNGKTLAFLLPILQRLIEEGTSLDVPNNTPRAIIGTPSRELAIQLYEVASSLGKSLGLKIRCVLGGSTKRKALYGERDRLDILIGTLGVLNKFLSNKYIHPNEVRFLAFDEADSLLDDTFSAITSRIIAQVQRNRKGDCKLLFIGATMPRNLNDSLGSVLDVEGIEKITTNGLHRVPIHITQKFIRTAKIGKFPVLLHQIKKDLEKKKKMLIFTNKWDTAAWLEHALKSENISAISFHNKVPYKNRHEHIQRFRDPDGVSVLCATDLASRGIDFGGSLSRVVNYDFPLNLSDYLHRIGRVGRVGCEALSGKVTNLVCTSLQVDLVQKIEKSLRLNIPIPNVNSNIVRIIEKAHRRKYEDEIAKEAIKNEMEEIMSKK